MIKKAIGFLLWLANSDPPMWGAKERFYQMKDRLLQHFGKHDGYDVQHIRKECWSCEGTGVYKGYYGDESPKDCYKCNNGIYEEFWTKLERWNIGGYSFHLPVEKRQSPFVVIYGKSEIGQIEGYIRHKRQKYYLADEALYWLALFFDWKLFKMTFGRCGHSSRKFTPLVVLATFIFNIKMTWQNIAFMPYRIKYWNERRKQVKLYGQELPF